MTPMDLQVLAGDLATDIIYELQVDRIDVGKYMISGYPDDYRIHISQHTSVPLTKQELFKAAALTKTEVESYLNGILRVGDQLVRQAQDANQIITLIEKYGPNANSADELWGNIEGALDTDTLSEEFRTLIEQSFATLSQGNTPAFHDMLQQLYPDYYGVRIPAMPDTDYGMEGEYSMSTPSMPFSTPGMPMPAKGLAAVSKAIPIRIVKKAQDDETPDDYGDISDDADFGYLDYYTQDVEPGSLDEVEQLINVGPEHLSGPPEEAPADLEDYLEQSTLRETEEQREETEELQEETPSEEESGEKEEPTEGEEPSKAKEKKVPKLPGYETEMTQYPDEPPRWWVGYRNIVGNLPPGTIDEIEERLDDNAMYREENDENLYTDEEYYKDKLGWLGKNYDISGMPADSRDDIKARDRARGRMRQQEFDEIWSPYALMHAFTIAGMPGMNRTKQYLEGWMRAHFGDEFGDRFTEVAGQASGATMYEENPELIRQINDWRDPKKGEGHGSDPTQWDREFLAKIPETSQVDTGLTLGDDPRRSVDLGTITVTNPIWSTYVRRSDPLKVPVDYGSGERPRLDDVRRLKPQFSEEGAPESGKGWASERQQRWYHSVGPGSGRR